ncbi:Atxe2 family lasso peptide isopeptidase [Luteimonas sp. TWI1416]|uniref:Atxe2 family lasso peptide isopeptidase n=1 Tax=unclassified Luteimonas TaxID=2629088 RepID=UPI003209124D
MAPKQGLGWRLDTWGLGLALGVLVLPLTAWATSPRQLVEIADFSSPVVSPDGRSVAFRVSRASIERNTYDTVWYVQAMDGGSPPRRVADGGVPLLDSAGIPVPAQAAWSPDSRWLYYRAHLESRVDVWRAAADGTGARAMTGDPADVQAFMLHPDGRSLRYSVGPSREAVLLAEQREYEQGIRLDRSAPLGQPLFRSGLTEGRLATQRLGQIFNRVPLAGTAVRWRSLDLETGSSRDVAGPESAPSAALPDVVASLPHVWQVEREPGGHRVAVLTRTGERSAHREIALYVAHGGGAGHLERCTAPACMGQEISGVQWRPGSDELLFTVTRYEAGFAQSIYRWNIATGEVQPVIASTGMLAGEGRWAPGACGVTRDALACVPAEASRPPRLERVDLQTGARVVLFDPNAALAQALATLDTQLLRWTDADGRTFTGQLYAAPRVDGVPPPLFITYYRCMGFVRGGSGDEWPLASLAAHGISTLCINAPSFSSDAAERYGVGLSAVESAIALLAADGRIDPARVGMGGLSFGSEVTMWTLMHSSLISAASLASPTTSQMYYLLGSNLGEDFLSLLQSNWQLGAPDATPEQWQRISPASNLDKIAAPILMQLPEQEYMHGLDYAIPLMRADRADVYVFPHAAHNKVQPRHKLAVYTRNLDWFRFWLLGREDTAPDKAAQYAHWRRMRERLPTPTASR